MRAIKTIATLAIAATVMTGNVWAKEWTVKVVKDNAGKIETVNEVKTCNYHEALRIGKTAVASDETAYFRMTGIDDKTACPPKSRKPKAETTTN